MLTRWAAGCWGAEAVVVWGVCRRAYLCLAHVGQNESLLFTVPPHPPAEPQVPNADFFLKTVPLLDGGQDVGMVLSPQVRERGCRGGMSVSWLAAGTTNSSCLSASAPAPPADLLQPEC